MRPWIKTSIVLLALGGFVVADAASAQRRRKAKRQEARAEQPKEQPGGVAAIDDAELVAALELLVYPAGGQTAEQQKADETECAGWARQQVGEMNAAPEPSPQQEEGRRDRRRKGDRDALRGAAKGAILGEALEDDEPDRPTKKDLEKMDPPDSRDEVGDNVRKAQKDDDPSAAEIGAVVGATVNHRRGKKEGANAEAEAAASAEQGELDSLGKALEVCLEGKGYEVE